MIFQKRLKYELKKLSKNSPNNCTVLLSSGKNRDIELQKDTPELIFSQYDISQIKIIYAMEENTFYYGSNVIIYLNLKNYPMKKPTVRVNFKFLHPGIDLRGNVFNEIFSKIGSQNRLKDFINVILYVINNPHKSPVINKEAALLLEKGNQYFKQYCKK
jgi:ubiquitin-protein ligase